MKDKKLVIAAIAFLVVVAIGLFFIVKPKDAKQPAKPAAAGKVSKAVPAPESKKAISKDMGALIVKLTGSKGTDVTLRMKVFRHVDSRSSILAGMHTTNRAIELSPGTYDIEIETMPAKIYKGVNVAKGRETVENLGRVTGSLEVKAAGPGNKAVSYPVRVLHSKTTVPAATGVSNRPIELVAGVYDVEIGSMPKQVRKDLKIEAGKEQTLDAGAAGVIAVKVIDESGKEVKGFVRIKKAEGGDVVASPAASRPVELMAGTYIVESAANPNVRKSDVKVIAGEEVSVELVMPARK